MRRFAIIVFLALAIAGAEEVPAERLRAVGDVAGKVSRFSPAKGRQLATMKVEAIDGNVKRVIIHVSPNCSGTMGLFFDGRPARGQYLSKLPVDKPFYVKVIGVGTVDLIPVYK